MRIHHAITSASASAGNEVKIAACGVGSRRNTSYSQLRLPRWWLIADAGLLEHAPERVVDLVVVVGQAELAREVRQVHRPRAQAGEPLDLGRPRTGCR